MDENIQLLIEAILSIKDTEKSVSQIKDDLKKIQSALDKDENARLNLIAGLDIAKTKNLIQTQLKSIINTTNVPKINLGVNIGANSSVKNAVGQINEGIQKASQTTDLSKTIFNAEQLNREGRMYVSKVTDVLGTVKNRFLKQGAKDVQFLEFKNANEQLKSFIATVDYGSGIIKKFNFEKAKIDTGGKKANNGFVQTNSMSVSDKSMASYQKTLNFLNTIDKRIADINSKTLLQNKPLQEGTVFYDNYINKLNSVLATINQVKNSNASLTDEEKRNIGLIVNELKNLAKEQQTAAYPPTKLASTSIGDSVKKYSAELAALEQKWKVQGILVGDFKTKVDQLKTSLSGVGTDKTALDSFRTHLSVAKQEASLLQKSMMETRGIDNLKTKIAVLTNQIVAYKNANGKAMASSKLSSNNMTFAAEIDGLLTKLQQAKDDTSYRQIANQFRVIRSEIKAMGLEGGTLLQRLGKNIKKFASWMGITTFTMSIARQVRGLFSTVYELDTALVDLKKTFKGTEQELQDLYYEANDIAKQLGVTTKEIIEQSSAWSRLGFASKQSALELAKVSSIFKSISPGMDVEQAQSTLTSVIKAYGIDVEEALDGVASKINVLGNNFALSNIDIAEALQRSSAAMSASNTDFDRTLALITAGQEIQQDADVVGTALKSISTRIRKMNEETGEFDETLQTISGDVYELTNQKVSIMADPDTYKDIYTILKEVSYVWDELTDKQHAKLLDKLFGTRQVNVGSAIIQNFSQAEKALEMISGDNANGNAMAEMEVIMDSATYKANEFKETLTEIAQSSITQDFLKSIIESGTRLLNVLSDASSPLNGLLTLFGKLAEGASSLASTIGLLPTIFAALSFKNVGELLNTPVYAQPQQICA